MPLRSALVALLLLTGCSLLPGTGGLDGAWTLVSGTHDGARLQLIDNAPLTLTIEGTAVSGHAACNGFSGSATISGSQFRLGDLASTMMGCDQPIMALESAYHAALGAVREARRSGDRLTLTGDGVELAYTLTPPTPDAALVETDWQLETMLTGGAASNAADFDRVTMRFHADGTVEGTAGCLTWNGSWTQDPTGSVAVTAVLVTETGCGPGPAVSAEDAVRSVVEGGFGAAVEGERLVLEPEEGIGLEFRPAS